VNCFSIEERIKLFGVSNQLIENDLDRVEREQTIDLARGHQKTLEKDQDYYPQIERDIRQEAEKMSQYYEIFYSLEKSIRRLIIATLDNVEPTGWWNTTRVPQKVFDDTNSRIQREIDSGVTRRSEDPIDFTNFGELGEIIKNNWDVFADIFSSASTKAVERVMSNLNTLRGPIAHCSPLAEDEALRLRLSVRDWFRLME
jgi:hypothetical protein